MTHPLGSYERPLALRVTSEEKLNEVIDICEHHGFISIIGLAGSEDLTDLRKAIQQKMIPEDVYSPCPCGSGKKFKFCCAKKPFEIGI